MTKRKGDAKAIFTVAELFCGCGGFSHGFAMTKRFNVVLGNDVKKHALATFKFNHSEGGKAPVIINGDIRSVSADRIIGLLKKEQVAELDVLIGGPPCQGFSQMKRGEERKGEDLVGFRGYDKLSHDPRNDLVLRFLEIAQVLHPKVIVIENVPQFLSHFYNGQRAGILLEVRELLEEMGYSVEHAVVNAADYGVPQLRERAVLIASRIGVVGIPKSTHSMTEERHRKPWVNVAEAISDLPVPPLATFDQLRGRDLSNYSSEAVSEYQKLMRSSTSFPGNHVTRKYKPGIIDMIREMRPGETWDDASVRMRKRYARSIKQAAKRGKSQEDAIEKLAAEGKLIKAFFKDYYWSAYTRLDWERPALTITANANFLGSGRFTHPEQDRGITMREAARLQSFDDNFTFITSELEEKATTNIGVGMDMIGEAVPPLLAKAIALKIISALDHSMRTPVVKKRAAGKKDLALEPVLAER